MPAESKICPLPWRGVYFATNGDIKPCSVSKCKVEGADPSLPADRYWNAIQNSALMSSVRRELLAGGQPANCKQCWTEEDHGLTSYRNHMQFKFPFSSEEARSLTGESGELNGAGDPLDYFDFRPGNDCNLKCRMCSTEQSNAWAKDSEFLTGIKFDSSRYQWHKDPRTWGLLFKKIEDVLASGRHVTFYLAGGELLMSKRHVEFLRRCVENGLAGGISLTYSSNITILHEEIFGLWARFRHVGIGASLDGVGEVNDYIRFPSRWKDLECNLDTLLDLEHVKIWIQPCVTVYNVFHMPELLLWANTKKSRFLGGKKPTVHAHLVLEPEFLSVQRLPQTAVDRLTPYYAGFKKDLCDYDRAFLDGVVEFAKAGSRHGDLEEFWSYTESLDRLRGQNIKKSLPFLSDCLASV
jgi:hypothetical protein